jgi:hypothetical protein
MLRVGTQPVLGAVACQRESVDGDEHGCVTKFRYVAAVAELPRNNFGMILSRACPHHDSDYAGTAAFDQLHNLIVGPFGWYSSGRNVAGLFITIMIRLPHASLSLVLAFMTD